MFRNLIELSPISLIFFGYSRLFVYPSIEVFRKPNLLFLRNRESQMVY
jgi:hypothetical protein